MAVRDDFAAGEVLAAADLNDTFAEKVPFAYGTATPSTTVEGFVWYDENDTPPTPKFWDGAAFQNVAPAGGLVLIAEDDLTGSSVSVNGCFTATYLAYRLIVRVVASASTPDLNMRMRVSGSDASGANYTHQRLVGNATSVTALRQTGLTSHFLDSYDTAGGIKSLDIFNPALALHTQFSAIGGYSSTPVVLLGYGRHEVSTAYDGFTLIASSGTFAADSSFSLYGYRI